MQSSSIQLNEFECIQFGHGSWLCCCNSDCAFPLQWEIRSHFVRWRVCINSPWSSGFQRSFYIAFACLPVSFTFWLWMGGILFYYYLKCHLCRDRDTSFFYRSWMLSTPCSICFALFRFQLNKIKWRERTYHLQSAPQNTASNWAKLFLRCVCVCE